MSISQNFSPIKPSLNLDFSNTKTLDPRITFSRPTGAVYYDGKSVTKAEENLLLNSQVIGGGTWAPNAATATLNNAVAPDGTTTASFITESATTNVHDYYSVTQQVISGNVYSYSVYIKAGTRTFGVIRVNTVAGGGNPCAWFNLSAGTLGTVNSPLTATITSVGNSWYRCTITFTPTGTSNTSIANGMTTTDGIYSYLGDGTSGLYLWGAQGEQRDTVTAYTPTTTQAITNYIPTLLSAPADTARFDHDPVTGESLGLLVEEQRTNLFIRSEDFSNVAWTKTALNLTSNTIVAPDGTLTGSKISTTSGTFASGLISTGNLAVASSSISVYAKASEAPILQIATYNFGNFQCYFDLTTGVSNGTVGFTRTMTNVGNGWWRCTVSGTLTAGGNFIFIPMAVNSGLNPAPIGQGIYIWGAQLEAGAFPTSYIKTEASQVTRSADSASMTGSNFSDWYRQDEGTLYAEGIQPVRTSAINSVIAEIGTGSNSNIFELYGTVSNQVGLFVTNGVTSQASIFIANGFPQGDNSKIAGAYKFNDFQLSSNGTLSSADTLGLVPTEPSSLFIGRYGAGSAILNGTIKKLAYYPQRLSNTQLQALTS